jgi:L-ascorbate metabolism protein UlaG (beta-lactamase superfamily)
MNIQLARHATLLLDYHGKKLLVDPMLSDVGANPPIPKTPNQLRNPLVPLAVPLDELLQVDALLITHTHEDHYDKAAAEKLPKHLPLFCQPKDVKKFQAAGFTDVRPIKKSLSFEGIRISRTNGKHGRGAIALMLAPVSGFVLEADTEKTLYIAGDTVWCSAVRNALDSYQPQVIVVNAGGARFNAGDPITMTHADIQQIEHHAPQAQLIAIHLEAINHCVQTRADLRAALGIENRTLIPPDGETIRIPQ